MLAEDLYFKTLSKEDLWKRYCGFLELSAPEFLDIQRTLLEEELHLAANSVLGRKILGKRPPQTVEEFRATVPLTTYEDYEPYLSEKREEALAVPPHTWCHSAGRSGKFKWVPHSKEHMDKAARNCIALCILSSASQRGEIKVGPGLKFLTMLPSVPYTSGCMFAYLRERFTFQPVPRPETVEGLTFAEQIAQSFEQALRDGFDVGGGIASVLVRMGQQMSGQASQSRKPSVKLLHPKTLSRLVRGWFQSYAQHRSIYPKDLWHPKGIMAGGLDMSIYHDEIVKYWGVQPFDVYGITEAVILAMQNWEKKYMTFLPDAAFLEFLLYSPQDKSHENERRTVLIDQLEENRLYEVILTQLHGMPLMRYRPGDVIRVARIGNRQSVVQLPQIEVRRKVGEEINLAGLCSLDERTVWRAIANTRLKYTDWTAYKEYANNETFLRLVIELKESRASKEVSAMVDEALRNIDPDYRDIDWYLGSNPVRTTLISEGTFARYAQAKVSEGSDLAHLKPRHIEPLREEISRLLELCDMKEEE
jgi:hypothetical protein